MHKGSRDQHPRAEVPAEKERIAGDGQFRKALDDDGEGAGEGAQQQDQEEGEDVEAGIVVSVLVPRAACWSGVILGLAAGYLSTEEVEGQRGQRCR